MSTLTRHQRGIIKIAYGGVAVIITAGSFATAVHEKQELERVPAACVSPALPAGDAARIAGGTYVCTDGVWVPVKSYGAPSRKPAKPVWRDAEA